MIISTHNGAVTHHVAVRYGGIVVDFDFAQPTLLLDSVNSTRLVM
ncbi:MAG: hypothetical protein ACOC2Z_06840 [Coleofasciculus sp.]